MGRSASARPFRARSVVAYVGNPHVVVRDDPKWTDAMREELASDLSSQMDGANVEFLEHRR